MVFSKSMMGERSLAALVISDILQKEYTLQ